MQWVAPRATGEFKLVRCHVDRNERIGAGGVSPEESSQPHASKPEYGDAFPGGDPRRIDHCAYPGHYGTTE